MGQLEGKAKGVVQLEGLGRGDRDAALAADACDAIVQQRRAGLERAQEALFLTVEDAKNVVTILHELGIDVAELGDHKVGETRQKRALDAQTMAMRDGAADDAPQDVAARLVGGQHTVGGEKRHRATMVGEHAQRLRVDAARLVRRTRPLFNCRDHRLEAVGLVDGVHVLQQGRNALDARARVDTLVGERCQRAVFGLVVLHKDEVPKLEEAIAVAARRTAVGADGASTAVLGATVVIELATRSARPGRAGLPKVVLSTKTDDAIRLHSLREPEIARLVIGGHLLVAGKDRDPDLGGVDPPGARHEPPGKLDRAGLEVVANRKVAHHLEEGQMASGLTDLVNVGRAEALLHTRQTLLRRLLNAEEVRLERLHTCGRQQDRRIERGRHETRGRHDEMTVLLEVGSKRGTDLVGQHCLRRVRDAGTAGINFALGSDP